MKQSCLARATLLVALAQTLFAVPGGAAPATTATRNPLRATSQTLAAGAQTYKKSCAMCHGGDLAGGMGPNLIDSVWLYGAKPGEIYRTIAEGVPRGMPKWNDSLTAAQIWELVAYIQARQPAGGRP